MSNFIPPNPFDSLMATLFNDEDTADIVLKVGKGENERTFFTHRAVLKKCAPELAQLCEDCDKSESLYCLLLNLTYSMSYFVMFMVEKYQMRSGKVATRNSSTLRLKLRYNT